jgi:hypothetical protein
MNLFQEKPVLPTLPTPAVWECPLTGLIVPKTPEANLQWRLKMMEEAERDESLRTDLYTACSQSLLFFVNSFCFTLRVFEPGVDGTNKQAQHSHLPFLTWLIQDEHLLRVEHAIDEGEQLLTDKSRDMGATWDHLIVYTHRLLFRPDESHLMISRKEEVVDQLDGQAKNYPFGSLADPGTLFGKIDYVLNRLPEWMLPKLARKHMHLVNVDTKTRIDGESSNASAGTSDRRTSIFLDEMAKMKEAESIKQSTRDVTACRLVCSTPNGAGTAFSKWRMSGQIPVFVLPWWEHPEKGAGRHAVQDKMQRWQVRSPWYDAECGARTPKEVATELDMDHVGSGDTFFEATTLEQHKRMFARPPRAALAINFKKKFSDDEIVQTIRRNNARDVRTTTGGPWKLWVDLVNRRPDQSKTYILSIDISKGQGASNSVINVSCVETREKIAEFADANTPPYELARVACAAALWFGGRSRRPLIIWENNGDPGFDFGRQLVHVYHYPNVYFDKQSGTLRQRVGKRYGFRSSQEKKAEALGLLRRAYAFQKYINRSEQALTEALTYISYEGGGIGPADLVNESPSARKAHGDRVIADMLFIWALADAGKIRKTEAKHPLRSVGGRMSAWKKAQKARKDGTFPTRLVFST